MSPAGLASRAIPTSGTEHPPRGRRGSGVAPRSTVPPGTASAVRHQVSTLPAWLRIGSAALGVINGIV